MAKREAGTAKRDQQAEQIMRAEMDTATTGDAMEQRVVAFAEQLGRIAGTVQGRAEGWMDRAALTRQISTVRDAATELLGHLNLKSLKPSTSGKPKASSASKTSQTPKRSQAARASQGSKTSQASKTSKSAATKPVAAASKPAATSPGRSGGVVDAPGKKHRGPIPSGPAEAAVHSQAAKMRRARTMVTATRRRGRG
jgi:hypothetical protein